MKKRQRKTFLFPILIGVMLGLFALFSCACEGVYDSFASSMDTGSSSPISTESSSSTPSHEEEGIKQLTLNKTQLSLLIGGNEKLKATYTNANELITWSTNNHQVATVSSTGMITAVSVGTAKITATADGVSASCVVTVGLGEYLPTLQLENYSEDSVSIATVDTVNLQSVIFFNGKTYEDGRISYALSDSSMGEIVDAKFFPLKKGEVAVTISAIWRGVSSETLESLKKTFTIRINKSISFLVNGQEPKDVELYTVERWGEETFTVATPFVPKAYIDGEETDCTLAFLGAENVVILDDGELLSCKKGETTLKLSCTDGQREYSVRIKAKVLRPVVEYDETFTNVSLVDGNVDAEGLFGSGAVLTEAYQNETPLQVKNNCVVGIQSNRNGETTTKVTLYTQEAGYVVTLKGYTKIIRAKEDLQVFEISVDSPFYDEKTNTVAVDGYFLVVNDIKEKGAPVLHNGTLIEYQDKATHQYVNGFYGVLEGAGHSITYQSGQYGLFGNIVANAAIRNLALTNITVDENASYENRAGAAPILANKISAVYGTSGVMENVYIGIQSGVQIGLVENRPVWFNIRNIVVEYGEEVQESGRGARGSLFGNDSYNITRKDNVSEDLNNVYIISKRGSPVDYHWSGKCIGYATNQTVDETAAEKTYQFSSIYQTETREELAQTIVQYNCDLSGFNPKLWDCSDGTPVWRGWTGIFTK